MLVVGSWNPCARFDGPPRHALYSSIQLATPPHLDERQLAASGNLCGGGGGGDAHHACLGGLAGEHGAVTLLQLAWGSGVVAGAAAAVAVGCGRQGGRARVVGQGVDESAAGQMQAPPCHPLPIAQQSAAVHAAGQNSKGGGLRAGVSPESAVTPDSSAN